jgi:hypothetical protein
VVQKRVHKEGAQETGDFEYLVHEQRRHEDLAETYCQRVNDHYCELCRHLMLAATVLIGLSGTIGVAPTLPEQLGGCLDRGVLFGALLLLILSLLSGAAYLWKSAKHLLSYKTAYEDISVKAFHLAEGLLPDKPSEPATKEYEDFYEVEKKKLTPEAGLLLLKSQIATFLLGAVSLGAVYVVTVVAR